MVCCDNKGVDLFVVTPLMNYCYGETFGNSFGKVWGEHGDGGDKKWTTKD